MGNKDRVEVILESTPLQEVSQAACHHKGELMVPRFITELENTYNKMFPNNPATIFYVAEPQEKKERFEAMLQNAVETKKPLTQEDLIAFFGERRYWGLRSYLSGWYDEEVLAWK